MRFRAIKGPILVNQPSNNNIYAVSSQVFPDLTGFDVKAFDDVQVTGNPWVVQGVTIFGTETGNSSLNEAVLLQFSPTHTFNNGSPTYSGTELSNGNLSFTNLNINLTPG